MDMESIQIFLDVWRTGSMTAAAEEHFMTQPALGKRIAVLEKELGVPLFHRGKGQARVALTPAGKSFCDIAQRMLLLYQQALELKDHEDMEVLTLASIRSAHDFVVPTLVMGLRQQFPRAHVTVEEHHTAEIIELLEKRRIDAGIIQQEVSTQRLKSRLLYSESYRVVVKKGSLLAEKEAVHPEELMAQNCIFQVFDSPFEDWFRQHWNLTSVKVRVNTTPTAEQYFSEPEDWMVVPEAVADFMTQWDFVAIPIVGELPVHRVYLCWNPDNQRKTLQWLLEGEMGKE